MWSYAAIIFFIICKSLRIADSAYFRMCGEVLCSLFEDIKHEFVIHTPVFLSKPEQIWPERFINFQVIVVEHLLHQAFHCVYGDLLVRVLQILKRCHQHSPVSCDASDDLIVFLRAFPFREF